MREYSIVKPSFWHDGMEVRRDGQTVGKLHGRGGEALGRTWVQTLTSLDGTTLSTDDVHDVRELSRRKSDANRVGFSLTWGQGGEPFGQLDSDKTQEEWRLHIAGLALIYWWTNNPLVGGGRFGFDDIDDQNYLSARRYPLRRMTWQRITVDDQLEEPEAIVAAQLGHILWNLVGASVGRNAIWLT